MGHRALVNSQIRDNQTSSSLQDTLESSALQLALGLGRKLFEGGLVDLASVSHFWLPSRMENASAQVSSQASVNLPPSELHAATAAAATAGDPFALAHSVQRVAGTSLISDMLEVTALAHCAHRLESFEQRLLTYHSGQARRELNTIRHAPPLSTAVARASENLQSTSLQGGPLAPLYGELWAKIQSTATAKIDSCQAKPTLNRAEVMTFKSTEVEVWLLTVAHLILSSGENLGQAVRNLIDNAASTSLVPLRGEEEGLYKKFSDFLAKRETLLDLRRLPESAWSWTRARTLAFERHFVKLAFEITAHIELMDTTLNAVEALNRCLTVGAQRNRALEFENYLYIDRLGLQLRALGENADEVAKLAEGLFQYVIQNTVPCSEVLEDEIIPLNPCINRETLVRARLELRLNDRHFPLSVAHKEWITQITKLETLAVPR